MKPISRRVNKPAFSPFLYRYRNLVERFFNKLKHFRAIATRYEKHASNYLAIIKLCTAPGSLDNDLHYAASLRLAALQRSRAAAGLTRPFFSISHSVL